MTSEGDKIMSIWRILYEIGWTALDVLKRGDLATHLEALAEAVRNGTGRDDAPGGYVPAGKRRHVTLEDLAQRAREEAMSHAQLN